MRNVGGWDVGSMRFEKALGTTFAISGLLRAVAWWIDRDMARRAVPKHVWDFRTVRPGHWHD